MSQFERIACIDRLLREQGSVRTAEVAERFEVSGRQVKRDIEYLRDRLDAPIAYSRARRAYRYERPFDELRFADEKLLLFYVLARSLAANEHYVPIVSAELLANLESHLARDYRPVSERISYELSLAEHLSMEDFTTVCQAMLLGRRLDLVYVDAKAQRSERSVEPARLVNYAGRWYLVAWDLLRERPADLPPVPGREAFHFERARRYPAASRPGRRLDRGLPRLGLRHLQGCGHHRGRHTNTRERGGTRGAAELAPEAARRARSRQRRGALHRYNRSRGGLDRAFGQGAVIRLGGGGALST